MNERGRGIFSALGNEKRPPERGRDVQEQVIPGRPADGAVDDAESVDVVVTVDFTAFYRAEYRGLVRLAYALTGSVQVAEELAQDSLVAAFRRWGSIQHFESPRAWTTRVLVNRCVSLARHRAIEAKVLLRLAGTRSTSWEPPEAVEDLVAAIRSLPRRQRQVVALAFIEDRSVEEIAGILGCAENTVRTHLRRARLRIAARLGLDETEH